MGMSVAEHRAVLRRAVTPPWLRWWLVAVLVAVACYYLGQWQWGRYEDKAARADRIERHYAAPAQPVGEVLGASPVPLEREWTRVQARGEYLDGDLLARNRPRDGVYGYEVLSRLELDDGSVLVVDRGWIPNSDEGAEVRPDVPAPPSGQVEVTGWVRQGERSLDRDPIPGQLSSINLAEASQEWGDQALLGGYVVRQQEQPAADPTPLDLDAPDTGTGPHLAYAIQWWLVIPAVFVLIWFFVRREERDAAAALEDAQVPDETTAAPPPRRTKVRIWDEEDG